MLSRGYHITPHAIWPNHRCIEHNQPADAHFKSTILLHTEQSTLIVRVVALITRSILIVACIKSTMLTLHMRINRLVRKLPFAEPAPMRSTIGNRARNVIASTNLLCHCPTAWTFLHLHRFPVLPLGTALTAPICQFRWSTSCANSFHVLSGSSTGSAPC